jgi:hypothetical protein
MKRNIDEVVEEGKNILGKAKEQTELSIKMKMVEEQEKNTDKKKCFIFVCTGSLTNRFYSVSCLFARAMSVLYTRSYQHSNVSHINGCVMTLTPDTLIILWRITRSTRSFHSLKRVNLQQEKMKPGFYLYLARGAHI